MFSTVFIHSVVLLNAFTLRFVCAQLPLPYPPYIPPNLADGALRTSGRPNPQWSNLLGNLLYFYEAQRSGELPSTNRVPWRNSSTLNDGKDVDLDLTGGYFDAGDYIKATFPLTAVLQSICWGAADFGEGYDATNQTVYLDDMLRWGLDWLMKAHPSPNTLYVLVGNTDVDDAYWGGDLNIPSFRPSYQINDTNPGTDAAAGASAAFSACASLYSNRSFGGPYSLPASLQNSSYAEKLLTHAQQLYTFAVNATGGQKNYQTSVPEIATSYGSSSYTDELTLAALLLSWATNSTSLYQQAEDYYNMFKLSGQNGVFNWDSKIPGLAVLFAQISQSDSSIGGNFSVWRDEAERYFDRIVNKQGPGYLTRDGLLYYDGDSDDASLNPALNAAMLLTRYAQIASTAAKKASYLAFARLTFFVALDYNAPLLTLAAMHVVNDTTDPFFTSLEIGAYGKVQPKGQPCDSAFPRACAGPQLSRGGKIAMAMMITIVGLFISSLLAWYLYELNATKVA
ncbi:Endoglucanase E-4 [Termitomyces sp. J132]|nr:Endoglucanase E-4 [Termitomyces sp. J132]